MKILAILFSVALALCCNVVQADAWEDAATAFKTGDYPEAVKLFLPLADKGNVRAQYFLGRLYQGFKGVDQNYQEALKWYRLAADQEFSPAQLELGNMYASDSGTTQSYQEAMKWWLLAAKKGNDTAQSHLGFLYEDGMGVEQSYKEAIKWFRLAADKGDVYAQRRLGVMYEYGKGVDKDYQEAMKWFHLAADKGDVTSQFSLGNMYENGEGVDKNYQEAMRWYRLAADKGDKASQYFIGSMYEYGNGVTTSYFEAMKWYRLAADQGDAAAQWKIGRLYEDGGTGVVKSLSKAYLWCSLAALNGDKSGGECRDDVAKLLTPAQVSRAQQIASECQKNNFKNCKEITQAESMRCALFFELRGETATSDLLGKPLFSYKRDELVAMKDQVPNCEAKTRDEMAKQRSAWLVLDHLIEVYDANAKKVAETERKTEKAAVVEKAVVKNATKIAALGFSKKWLKAPVYLRTYAPDGSASQFVILENLLALLFENPRFSKITAIKSGKFEGVLMKVQGAQSTGILFKYDDDDLFPSHTVIGDRSTLLESASDFLQISLVIMQLAEAAIQDVK